MSGPQLLIILALCGYAVYRQSIRHVIDPANRFRMAIIYGIVGLVIGGIAAPHSAAAWGVLAASLAASVVVGVARGCLTHIWRDTDGTLYAQGTAVTIGLFLTMIAFKFALGFWAGHHHIQDKAGMGEILVMMAVMIAFQAQLVTRRAERLGGRTARAPGLRIEA